MVVERPVYRYLHLIFAIGIAHLIYLGMTEMARYSNTSNEVSAATHRVQLLESQVSNLKSEIKDAKSEDFRDGMVRRYGYVKKTETLIRGQ